MDVSGRNRREQGFQHGNEKKIYAFYNWIPAGVYTRRCAGMTENRETTQGLSGKSAPSLSTGIRSCLLTPRASITGLAM